MRAIFEAPTVDQLHQTLEQACKQEQDGWMTPIPATGLRKAPLSFAQQRLWFLSHIEGGNRAYTMPMAVKLTGPLNVKALEKSLGEVIRRHGRSAPRFSRSMGPPSRS